MCTVNLKRIALENQSGSETRLEHVSGTDEHGTRTRTDTQDSVAYQDWSNDRSILSEHKND